AGEFDANPVRRSHITCGESVGEPPLDVSGRLPYLRQPEFGDAAIAVSQSESKQAPGCGGVRANRTSPFGSLTVPRMRMRPENAGPVWALFSDTLVDVSPVGSETMHAALTPGGKSTASIVMGPIVTPGGDLRSTLTTTSAGLSGATTSASVPVVSSKSGSSMRTVRR